MIEPRYFINQLADALIPAEGNRNRNDKASSCSRCGVIEPIMREYQSTMIALAAAGFQNGVIIYNKEKIKTVIRDHGYKPADRGQRWEIPDNFRRGFDRVEGTGCRFALQSGGP